MAKEKVSAQQKKELLALNQKDLTVPMISKLFGKTTSKKDGKFVINSNKAKIDSFEDISCTPRITTGRSSKEPIELKYITNDNEVILPITIKSL